MEITFMGIILKKENVRWRYAIGFVESFSPSVVPCAVLDEGTDFLRILSFLTFCPPVLSWLTQTALIGPVVDTTQLIQQEVTHSVEPYLIARLVKKFSAIYGTR
jgi:hypothetical protein